MSCVSTLSVICVIVVVIGFVRFFVFDQKTAYEMRISDWSSDVCSSDLEEAMLSRLTPAELRVVVALASGITNNDEIADHLRVSVHTVRSQVKSALRQLALDDRTQLALWGARHQLGYDPA